MKDIYIKLKKDYIYATGDIMRGYYTYTKINNTILIENIKKLETKNGYLVITYKDLDKIKKEKLVELTAIEKFETM